MSTKKRKRPHRGELSLDSGITAAGDDAGQPQVRDGTGSRVAESLAKARDPYPGLCC